MGGEGGEIDRLHDAMDDIAVALDRHGVVTYVNRRACELLGWARADLIGRDWFDTCLPEPDRDAVRGVFSLLMAGEIEPVARFENLVLTADGTNVQVAWHNTLLREAGRIVGTFSVGLPSPSLEAPESARANLYAGLFDAAPIGYAVVDADDHIHLANATVARMLDKHVEDLTGVPFAALFPGGPERERVQVMLTRARAGEAIRPQDTELIGPDSEPIPVQLSSAGDVEDHGMVRVALLDRSELRRTEEDLSKKAGELQRSNGALREFTYAVSHDLQEPLRTVGGFVQLLQREHQELLSADAREYLAFIGDGTRRMRALIRGLLEYSRVETRAKPFTAVECRDAVDRALVNLRAAMDEAAPMLDIGALPVVQADASQLMLLFQNLLSNALKFRKGPGPAIRIWATELPSEWEIRVADDGVGVHADHHARIFEMFGRGPEAAGREGTGAGLSICKRIVERHGGRIHVESTPDQGAVFIFTIPST